MNARRAISLLAVSTVVIVLPVNASEEPTLPPYHSAERVPAELEGVGITEKLNQPAPLDLSFVDEHGKPVTLRDYLKPGRPIILTPVYYNCPQLCNLTLNGMVNGLNEIDMSAGKEFLIISFSINHNEKPQLAEVKKRAYLTQYTRESAKDGWHFLTGSEDSVTKMCEAVGFGFKADGKGDFAHTATIIFITPEGVISRYMNNVVFEPRDLRFALIESSKGAIGSAMDKFLLFMCYHYDPKANSYAASAMKIMRLSGFATLMCLAAGMGLLWWKGSRRMDHTQMMLGESSLLTASAGHSPVVSEERTT